jgi:hypothetical protein
MITIRCKCGWPRPAIAVARADGSAVDGQLLVRGICPICEAPYTAGEIAPELLAPKTVAAAETVDPADRELALVVAHVRACADVLAAQGFVGAARNFHMLAIGLGDHHVHRPGARSREQVIHGIVDTLRKVGFGGPQA